MEKYKHVIYIYILYTLKYNQRFQNVSATVPENPVLKDLLF